MGRRSRFIGPRESGLARQRTAQPSGMSVVVGVAAAYGYYVEFGTRRMKARPFFLPAVESVRGDLRSMGVVFVGRRVQAAAK